MVGVVKLQQALAMAEDIGLDLVEVSPNAKPPVCKILDHGKFKFEAQKKAAKAKKKQKVIEIKELKFREVFKDSPMKRSKFKGLKRNINYVR